MLAADNMFRRWRTEVKRLLRPGEKRAESLFPLADQGRPAQIRLAALPLRGHQRSVGQRRAFRQTRQRLRPQSGLPLRLGLGPAPGTSGIWRPVYLEGWNGIRISDVFYRQQEVTARRARVEVEVEIASVRDLAEAVVTVASPGEGIEASVTAPLRSGINKVTVPLDIASPKLWWTRELGEPHLYEFRTSVAAGDASDSRTTRIGLRSLRLVRDEGLGRHDLPLRTQRRAALRQRRQLHPLRRFPAPRHARRLRKTIDDAAAVNMNMLRVWGGGVYEDDVFYELCDERGILVWQDFMFACSVYPAEGAWLEKRPARSRRQHPPSAQSPSIAVWCGNNECNEAWFGWGWNTRYAEQGHPEWDRIIGDQLRTPILRSAARSRRRLLARHALPPLVALVASRRHERKQRRRYAFLESVAQPRTDRRLQRHAQPFLQRIRLSSHSQNMPSVLRFAPEERDWDIESEVMMAHQRGGDFANMRIRQYLEDEYWPARDFRTFLYMSHVLQGDAIKTAIEAHRRDKPYCWGSLFWQHNDCWPVASWASRDWYGRWKAQHYFARPAFDDILVSPLAEGNTLNVRLVSDRRKTVGQTPDNGHGHGRRPPLGKHPQPNRRTQCQSECLFGRHFRTLARLRPQSGDRRRGIHDRRTPLRQHRIFRLSKRA